MSPARIAVLMGGRSSEHDISVSSGRQVLSVLQDQSPLPVLIGRDGTWQIGDERQASVGAALEALQSRADVVFIALHGPGGEDGVIQGCLETVGVPYTGSGVLGSALAMDKPRTKLIYTTAGIPTPPFQVVTRARWRGDPAEVLESIKRRFGFPCVLKRAREGSSYGISFPADEAAATKVLDQYFEKESVVLAEKQVKGREFTCAVLEVSRESRTLALPVTEIIPGDKYAFFDLEAKYTPGATREITPAEIPDELRDRIQAHALAAHEALDLRDMSRSDVLVDDGGNAFLLETNTIPGFTPTSLLPQAAAAAGYDFRALVNVLIENALLRAEVLGDAA